MFDFKGRGGEGGLLAPSPHSIAAPKWSILKKVKGYTIKYFKATDKSNIKIPVDAPSGAPSQWKYHLRDINSLLTLVESFIITICKVYRC